MFTRLSLRRILVPLAAAALAITSCGPDGPDAPLGSNVDDSSESADATAGASGVVAGSVEANGDIVEVVALDNTFRTGTIEVAAGTAIRWENRGRNDHDVVPVDDMLTWGVDSSGFAPGDVYTVLFDTPGVYRYFCSIHGTESAGMIGTVVVTAGA